MIRELLQKSGFSAFPYGCLLKMRTTIREGRSAILLQQLFFVLNDQKLDIP